MSNSSPGNISWAAEPSELATSFQHWRDSAASRRRLRELAASFRPRRLSCATHASSEPMSEPQVTHTSTWAERDAALRASAISLPTSASPTKEEPPSVLPFNTAADLPPDLATCKDRAAICNILQSRVDRTLGRWRRRILYSDSNWAEWAEWSKPSANHRDRIEAGRVFLEPASILTAPHLRSPHTETAADAWNIYRRHLFILIRQALTVGFPWTEILTRPSRPRVPAAATRTCILMTKTVVQVYHLHSYRPAYQVASRGIDTPSNGVPTTGTAPRCRCRR